MPILKLAIVLTAYGLAQPAAGADGPAKDARHIVLAEARTQLTNQILALPVTEKINIGDLPIAPELSAWVAALPPAGARTPLDPTRPRGSVILSVKLVEVYRKAKALHLASQVSGGSARVSASDFDKRIQTAGATVLRQRHHTTEPPPELPGLWRRRVSSEGIHMAQQAARRDAHRKLLAQVGRLEIARAVTVGEFAAQGIGERLSEVLQGARQLEPAGFRTRELICDLRLELPLDSVYRKLKRLHKQYYTGKRVKAADIDAQIASGNAPAKVLTATGSAPPPTKFLKASGESRCITASMPPRPDWPATLRATGKARLAAASQSDSAQARLKAIRAARADADAHGLDIVCKTLRLTGRTRLGDFVALDQRIGDEVTAYVAAARLVDSTVYGDGTAAAVIEIDTRGIWSIVWRWQKELGVRIK